jgi:hypothetical protein
MPNNQETSTHEHLNKIIAFRQAVYEQAFTRARDAQFELLDALLLSPHVNSFPELSLSPVFRRQWHSVYVALGRGQQDQAWLRGYLCAQVPGGDQVFALDKTVWEHPHARTLSELCYERSPSRAIEGHSIVQGHPYSLLGWVPEVGQSWALPISSERITPTCNAGDTGVAQVHALYEARSAHAKAADEDRGVTVIAGDGAYGNHRFLGGLAPLVPDVVAAVRLRCDRVLFGPPGPYSGRGRRDLKHGDRFAFKDLTTWGEPAAQADVETADWGRVRLRQWPNLHAREEASVVFSVMLCEVHLEREQPPKPLWLAYLGPPTYDPVTIWRWYPQRWPIEPAIRFRKQRLYWCLPQLQQTERCDRWTTLVDLAVWQLWLARDLVRDQPLPWQQAQPALTPGRVKQSLAPLFAQFPNPACVPQTRGYSPGWPAGRPRTRPRRFSVVKRGRKRAQKT